MTELKLEVGKKYVDGLGIIERCVAYDDVKDVYITVTDDGDYNHYKKDGVALTSNYSSFTTTATDANNLSKEYKEPQTVSGWVNVFICNGGEIQLSQHIGEDKESAININNQSDTFIGIIHLDNVEIKEV